MDLSSHEHLRSKKIDVNQDLRSYEINQIVIKTGLANERFIPYHCKAVKQLGPAKYLELADLARKGKNPATLMSYLLKQEMH